MPKPRILYCHCAYAKVIPEQVKNEVLRRLGESGVSFELVADLCEMSARKDASLARHAGCAKREADGCAEGEAPGPLRIAACYPRAVRWLFSAANAPLPEDGVEIRNMRRETADEVVSALLDDDDATTAPPATGDTPSSDGAPSERDSGDSATNDDTEAA